MSNMSYASRWENDRFPETFVAVEGTDAGVSLGADYEIRMFTRNGATTERAAPHVYNWADPDYSLIHASIVDCHRNLLGSLRGDCEAETTGDDNLRTLELVFAAYESAEQGKVITIN